MQTGEELLAPYLTAEPGTVGALLASPAGRSPFVRAGVASIVLAASLGVLGVLGRLFGGVPALSALVDVRAVASALLWVAALLGAAGAALACYGVVRDRRGFDRDGAARRAILAHLVSSVPRLGITRASRLDETGLRARRVAPGTSVFTVRGGFHPEDLRGLEPTQLGAVDMVVSEGRLTVFYTVEAKRRFTEKVTRI